MGDGIFTRKGGDPQIKGDTSGLAKHHKHANFRYAEKGVDGTEYKDGASVAGMEGTVVPTMSPNGGVKGSDNAYGKCIAGHTIRGTADGSGEEVGELFIPAHLEAERRPKEEAVEEPEEEEDDEEPEGDDDEEEEPVVQKKARRKRKVKTEKDRSQQSINAVLAQCTEDEPPPRHEAIFMEPQNIPDNPMVSDLDEAMTVAIREVDLQNAVGDPRQHRVEFRGSFGRYRGHYSQVCIDGPFIALVYSLDEATYSPPASDELFTLSCGEDTHEVYFAGVEFTLPFLDSGVQVLIRKK
jgi:hypothetical protein